MRITLKVVLCQVCHAICSRVPTFSHKIWVADNAVALLVEFQAASVCSPPSTLVWHFKEIAACLANRTDHFDHFLVSIFEPGPAALPNPILCVQVTSRKPFQRKWFFTTTTHLIDLIQWKVAISHWLTIKSQNLAFKKTINKSNRNLRVFTIVNFQMPSGRLSGGSSSRPTLAAVIHSVKGLKFIDSQRWKTPASCGWLACRKTDLLSIKSLTNLSHKGN